MSRQHFVKDKYLSVGDGAYLDQSDGSLSGSLPNSFSNSFATTFSNPFTAITNDTAALHSDKHDQADDYSGPPQRRPKRTWLSLESTSAGPISLTIYDIVLFLVPVLLLVKVALVVLAWQTDKGHNQHSLDQASPLTLMLIRINEQMVTAFTVVFAAILSTLMRRYALYLAQQGTTIGRLEQFNGSTNLLSTVRVIWGLRSFGWTSVALLLVWSLYYLGSQASGLEYRLISSKDFQDMVAVIPSAAAPSVYAWPDPSSFTPLFSTLRQWNFLIFQLCTTAIWYYISQITPGADWRRAVVVPNLKVLTNTEWTHDAIGSALKPDHRGWYDVSKQSEVFATGAFTATIGWPVRIYNGSDDTTVRRPFDTMPFYLGDYTFSPTYLALDCSQPTLHPYNAFPNGTVPDQTISFNMTPPDSDAPKDVYGNAQRSLELRLRLPDLSNSFSMLSLCNISQMTVDLRVQCRATGCFSQSMRWTNGSVTSATSFGTVFNDPEFSTNFLNYAATNLRDEVALIIPISSGNISWGSALPGVYSHASVESLDAISISGLMTAFFNTFYLISLRWNHAGYTPDELINHSAEFNMTTVPFRGALYDPHYAIYWEWITVDLICCLVLLAAAVTSIVLRMRTTVPDVLGSVSSLTMADPDFRSFGDRLPLSGLERTRTMKGVQVRLRHLSSSRDGTGQMELARLDIDRSRTQIRSQSSEHI